MSNFFLHNFADLVVVETTWITSIIESHYTRAESRLSRADNPKRAVTFRWTGLSKAESFRMLMSLMRQSQDWPSSVPLYSDQARTTALSNGVTINAPTTDRRFMVGGDVVIVSFGGDGRPDDVEIKTIQALAAGAITLTGALVSAYPTGSFVCPMIYSDEILRAPQQWLNDRVAEVGMTIASQFWVGYGVEATSDRGVNPTGFPTQGGYPILDVEGDWSEGAEVSIERAAIEYQIGNGSMVVVRGDRPQFKMVLNVLSTTRADAMSLVRFFDSRAGRAMPFWLVWQAAVFEPVAINTGFVDVEAMGDIADPQDFLEHIAIVMRDGTYYVRSIAAIALNGSQWRISFGAVIPAISLANIARVAPALFARFDDDTLREEWHSDEICRMSFKVAELLNEAVAEIA